ncbi:hypothetical protein CHLRE_03g153550v5 [Chlamydomonas reinhardtii]|uniref:Uncharacterized protein n=1 Tax=Chlamydomonas reinhardtii TaxID=3055 RepID=A0A2K3DVW5_CHLRE|nr:uncharacterized protein CHLRE_03g153550v5 [Chlamydomonas reinhardtii]PNW84662.1 hypothetical protein CHLRE_03g153550v5 [Chlamydomonas reinhardtii]
MSGRQEISGREAGESKVRMQEQGHAGGGSGDTHSAPERDSLYKKLMDPHSDFPEPALKGEHLNKVMNDWLPSSPVSPSKKKSKAHGTKRLPVAGVRGGVEAKDEPNDVNHDVGEFHAKVISPHGHAHTAAGVASGFGGGGEGAATS